MKKNLQLNLHIEPEIGFSYSSSDSQVTSINNIQFDIDIKLGKTSAGQCSIDFKEVIEKHTNENKKSAFDRQLTITLYEEMISQLHKNIDLLK